MGMVKEMKRYKKWIDVSKMIELKSYEVYKISAKLSHQKLLELKKTRRLDIERKMRGFRNIMRRNHKREEKSFKLMDFGLA